MMEISEGLNYVKKFKGETFVVKFGGSTLNNKDAIISVGKNLKYLMDVGINVVLIHGGGPLISGTMKSLNLKVNFYNGERITDEKSLYVVIGGLLAINKDIVEKFNEIGVKAVGIGGIIYARRKENLGFVGEVEDVKLGVLKNLTDEGYLPVINPIGIDIKNLTPLNINADFAATEIAQKLNAKKFIVLTSAKGVLDKNGNLMNKLTLTQCDELIADGTITEGMIPKIRACKEAIQKGVESAHIVCAYEESLINEIFTEKGSGTMIILRKEKKVNL
ncbi:MAG: acetylglutamate kinase [Candidatus Altiarchaeales archaeon HGW-Altiarchaeales-1]|nr:MAG: acetylglutamate kinase [Candidatus Altiarchaeales archaeon HGW-Altiarchaeales-1]